MYIFVVNMLGFPISVTVVEHSKLAVQFLVSLTHVPVPAGTILKRDILQHEEVLMSSNLDEDARPTISQRQMNGPITIRKVIGKSKKTGETVVQLFLLSAPDDEPPKEAAA
jgi:hypothetical protein